ncbi:hypothetical protein OIU85_013767 [Salix viminalis]|uniref:Reverse transcriptase zinc-binding domain-containing protein n=1 Tax=Salix viminalis TaxID=40686 RepID=A0A9Q0NMA2_SALVM|nr:hypothetical protein OIU85_013767 [Salix viminalis]
MDRLPSATTEDQRCRLCHDQVESHAHLFFACNFSLRVRWLVSNKAKMHWPNLPWDELLEWLQQRTTPTGNIMLWVSFLVLSSMVYHIWQERNRRRFDDHSQPAHMLYELIARQIRVQLMEYPNRQDIPEGLKTIWNIED